MPNIIKTHWKWEEYQFWRENFAKSSSTQEIRLCAHIFNTDVNFDKSVHNIDLQQIKDHSHPAELIRFTSHPHKNSFIVCWSCKNWKNMRLILNIHTFITTTS